MECRRRPGLIPNLGDKMKILKNARIFALSLIGPRSGFLQRFPCDVIPFQEDYKYAAVRIDWESLWSANAFEKSLWSFVCSASWKAGEVIAIESAVTVIISELLSVCVARSGSAVNGIASDVLSACV
ncbi:hypothetical protein AVEN_215942-1 [Araneus ventricosus]|uniref:Uncharacterized protein n=1 Tax=Araneus ventricosus TaxID=182803 RepID=A0A4Y2HH23_ARAVE|nr:hypothetical protein AVEN_215942-1 [Araneus ventricosus]